MTAYSKLNIGVFHNVMTIKCVEPVVNVSTQQNWIW